MKVFSKIAKFGLAVVIAAFTLTAQAQELTGTLKKIKDSGTITLGHRDTSIPFSYYDDKQQVIGYAMDICMKIVDAVKAELKMPESQGRPQSRHVGDAHPADGQRHDRPRMRFDHQQSRPPEAGELHQHPLRHGQPLRREEVVEHQEARGPQGQDRRLDGRHDEHQVADRGERQAEPRHEHPDRPRITRRRS
jgi:ABC-type amino acid transport substrate-binding protein